MNNTNTIKIFNHRKFNPVLGKLAKKSSVNHIMQLFHLEYGLYTLSLTEKRKKIFYFIL